MNNHETVNVRDVALNLISSPVAMVLLDDNAPDISMFPPVNESNTAT
jgi:hypothetical protein